MGCVLTMSGNDEAVEDSLMICNSVKQQKSWLATADHNFAKCIVISQSSL